MRTGLKHTCKENDTKGVVDKGRDEALPRRLLPQVFFVGQGKHEALPHRFLNEESIVLQRIESNCMVVLLPLHRMHGSIENNVRHAHAEYPRVK